MMGILRKFVKVPLLHLSLVISATSLVGQTEHKCDLSAFVADETKPLVVRSSANDRSQAVYTIPVDDTRTMVDVTGTTDGWLKIAVVQNSRRSIFSGIGWVPASSLAVMERKGKYRVHHAPSTTSAKISVSLFNHRLPIESCRSEWVRIGLPSSGTSAARSRLGWMPAGSYCGNPWIDCE